MRKILVDGMPCDLIIPDTDHDKKLLKSCQSRGRLCSKEGMIMKPMASQNIHAENSCATLTIAVGNFLRPPCLRFGAFPFDEIYTTKMEEIFTIDGVSSTLSFRGETTVSNKFLLISLWKHRNELTLHSMVISLGFMSSLFNLN